MQRKNFLRTSLAVGITAIFGSPAASHPGSARLSTLPRIVRSDEGRPVTVLGDRMRIKLTAEDTNGLFTLIEEDNAAGVQIPPHIHEHEDEVFYVLAGELELTVGDQTTVLQAGDLAFGPRGVPHSWRTIGSSTTRVLLSVFPAGLEAMFAELGELPPGPPDMATVTEVCGRYGIRFV
ncbi:Quercetin 2,3-dioxygenase [Neolewinella maritima]|uniref:Quercetin 2,3-dioxygenase n=1 Tax=Neolewinella maritima TaxID=1383882 RepID=A0ABM9AWU4_9BACT|nr:quercetin 2,3-dioxygenase [Neolewinella maritima]CAH0998875.1 Quercetin 2,3-dioxygenase [Neolewinella maritima]